MSFFDLVKQAKDPQDALKNAITDAATQRRIPVGAMFELSPVCNFTCPFCYARRSPAELQRQGERIKRFPEWKRLIDEACALGTLELTLTGGECMLHPDFAEIYRYAYEQGLAVSMMTNGSCVTPEILELFRAYPPTSINVTLYGGSPETYARVCGNASYFDRVLANIRALRDQGSAVYLQFTAGKDNLADLKPVARIAKELGIKLRYARAEFSFRRATPETLDACEVSWQEFNSASSELNIEQFHLSEEQYKAKEQTIVPFVELPVVEKGMTCGAGVRSFFIDYLGYMHPCVSLDDIKCSTEDRPLSACWQEIVGICGEIPQLTECVNCLHRSHCKQCVALHYDDLKEFGRPSPRLCFKCQFPERASEIEARFARDGYLRASDLE